MGNDYALITGASSGIGLEYARALASMGYNLILVGNRADENSSVAEALRSEYGIDAQPVYAGMNSYDGYRMEQLEWLKKEAATKQFKAAKNRIVLMHIPPIVTDDPNSPEEYASTELERMFKPLFNELGIDIVISGHTHRHIVVEPGERGNDYPILTNDNEDVMLVNSDKNGIRIKIVSEKDQLILDRKFK